MGYTSLKYLLTCFQITHDDDCTSNFAFPFATYKIAAIDKLRVTSLEYTSFLTGVFLDYFGMPHAPTYLSGLSIIVDVVNMKAAIPGKGNTPIVFTYTADVATFVAASLDLAAWPEKSVIAGDKITSNQLVGLVEKARGKWSKGYMGHYMQDLGRVNLN